MRERVNREEIGYSTELRGGARLTPASGLPLAAPLWLTNSTELVARRSIIYSQIQFFDTPDALWRGAMRCAVKTADISRFRGAASGKSKARHADLRPLRSIGPQGANCDDP